VLGNAGILTAITHQPLLLHAILPEMHKAESYQQICAKYHTMLIKKRSFSYIATLFATYLID